MSRENSSYFKFWGTRGSTPVSGGKYVKYGGNTSCLEINANGDVLLFDAGSGIRELGVELAQQKPRKVYLFVGHTHWDHIQGFPFFTPAYIPGFELEIYGASGFGKDLQSIFQGQLDRDYFPVQLDDMSAKIEFKHLKANPLEIGQTKIYWEYTHHPGAAAGFKIELNGKKIVYVSDNEFLKGYTGPIENLTRESEMVLPYLKIIDFVKDVDIFISEAQYHNDEYQKKIGWGHSSISNASLFAKLGNVKRWIVTHHDPMHDDSILQKKLDITKQTLKSINHPIPISNAFDGLQESL